MRGERKDSATAQFPRPGLDPPNNRIAVFEGAGNPGRFAPTSWWSRGFEPPTSSICTIFESSTKKSLIFSFAGPRERVAPARTALRACSDRMPPSILAPSSSFAGSARRSSRRGVHARARARRFHVRRKIDLFLIWSSSIGRSWFPIHDPLAQGNHGDGPHWTFPSFVNGPLNQDPEA
jgi:hypothetical protein